MWGQGCTTLGFPFQGPPSTHLCARPWVLSLREGEEGEKRNEVGETEEGAEEGPPPHRPP